jgi:hypothetical protein
MSRFTASDLASFSLPFWKIAATCILLIPDSFPGGEWLLLNAVWGLRRKEMFLNNFSKPIPKAVQLRALEVWLWLLQRGRPVTVDLCGSWMWHVRKQVREGLPTASLEVLCHPASMGKILWKNKERLRGYLP